MNQLYYAVKNKNNEIREKSSSGGAFFEFANYVLKNNGIVYGTAYDNDFKAKVTRIENVEEIGKLFGSKYVKSDMNNSLQMIRKDILSNKTVLFSGTPCQVASVKNYLRDIDTSKLILIDIICHGTPESKYYLEYLKYMELKYKSKIKDINMRYKEHNKYVKQLIDNKEHSENVMPKVMRIVFENGKVYKENSIIDKYYQLFDHFTSPGCFKCPYSNLNRVSDITIGDFHQFSSKLGKFNDGNGVSLLIINTNIGKKIFDLICKNFEFLEKESTDVIQPAIEKPMNKPYNYEEFLEYYKNNGFKKTIDKFTRKKYKIIIKKYLNKLRLIK